MKKTIILAAAAGLVFASCANESARYTDLETGKAINIEKDEASGKMVDADTKKPVYIYVDNRTNDTIHGETGKTINGEVKKGDDGKYMYSADAKVKSDGDGEYKVKDGDFKMKVEADGDMKIKDGDKKIKVEGETGETKVKND